MSIDTLTKVGAVVRRQADGRIGTLHRLDAANGYAYVDMGGGEADVWAGTLDAFELASVEDVFAAYRLTDQQRSIAVDLLDTARSDLRLEKQRVVDLIKEKTAAEVQVQDFERRIRDLSDDLRDANAKVARAEARHRDDIATIGERLLDEAKSRGWCDEFDEVVDDLNALLSVSLPRRLKDYDVYVPVQVMVRVSVSAYDEGSARDEAGNTWREQWDSTDARDIISEGSTLYDAEFTVEEID